MNAQLFDQLCTDLGLCLRRDHIARLLKDQPEDVYSFTNAVFAAAGLNPERADRQMWRQVRQRVAAAFEAQAEQGEPQRFATDRASN